MNYRKIKQENLSIRAVENGWLIESLTVPSAGYAAVTKAVFNNIDDMFEWINEFYLTNPNKEE